MNHQIANSIILGMTPYGRQIARRLSLVQDQVIRLRAVLVLLDLVVAETSQISQFTITDLREWLVEGLIRFGTNDPLREMPEEFHQSLTGLRSRQPAKL